MVRKFIVALPALPGYNKTLIFYLIGMNRKEAEMTVAHVTDKNFEAEVLKSNLPVLVDFWAEWCGPCRMISPIVEEIAKDLQGKLKVAKVNVDEAQELAAQFNIMSIPTLLIFKKGQPVEQMVGAMSKDQLLTRINTQLS